MTIIEDVLSTDRDLEIGRWPPRKTSIKRNVTRNAGPRHFVHVPAREIELQIPRQIHQRANRYLMSRGQVLIGDRARIGAARIGMELKVDVAVAAAHLPPVCELGVHG